MTAISTDSAAPSPAPASGASDAAGKERPLTPQQRLEEARAGIKSRHRPTQLAAIRGLLELDVGEGIAAVRSIVETAEPGDRKDEAYAAIAVRLLREVDDAAVNRELRRYFQEDSLQIQRSAARTLEQRGDPSAMQTLITEYVPQLLSTDVGTRVLAVRELGSLESPLVAEALMPMLKDRDSAVRSQAVESISTTADPITARASIEPLLKDPALGVRTEAAFQLDQLLVDSRPPQLVVESSRLNFSAKPGEMIQCVKFGVRAPAAGTP